MKPVKTIFMLFLAAALMLMCSCAAQSEYVSAEPTALAPGPQQSLSAQVSADAQTSPSDGAGFKRITAEEAKSMMDENKDAVIVDVRNQNEYQEKHIKGAVLIPLDTITDKMPKELPDLNAVILVYCASGKRSNAAAQKLASIGYTNIYDFGGINSWPYDTVSGDEK